MCNKKNALIKKAKQHYKHTKVPIKSKDYKIHNISQSTVTKYFGSWNNFLKKCEIPTYQEYVLQKNTKKCRFCNKTFIKNRSKNIFCSSSCASSFNNKKTKLKHGKYVNKYGEKTCPNCNKSHNRCISKFCSDFCSLMDLNKKSTKKDKIKKNSRNQYTLIRMNARIVAKYLNFDKCCACSYDKHYEVAHRKDIKDFDDNTTLYEINNPDNLIPLCRNCHWEFDNGFLKL